MRTCKWNDNLIIASDVSDNYKFENVIRKASRSGELRCIDCSSPVKYRHGEKTKAHFSHICSTNCEYDAYDNGMSETIKKLTEKLYEVLKTNYNVKIDEKILANHYVPLVVCKLNGEKIAIEIVTNKMSRGEIEKLLKLYKDAQVNVSWILFDYEMKTVKENQTYAMKRFLLNETKNKSVLMIDGFFKVKQYIIDNDIPYHEEKSLICLSFYNDELIIEGFFDRYSKILRNKTSNVGSIPFSRREQVKKNTNTTNNNRFWKELKEELRDTKSAVKRNNIQYKLCVHCDKPKKIFECTTQEYEYNPNFTKCKSCDNSKIGIHKAYIRYCK